MKDAPRPSAGAPRLKSVTLEIITTQALPCQDCFANARRSGIFIAMTCFFLPFALP
jgi:hypothetical protein